MTADQHVEPVGLILHNPIRYDLRLWLMTRGREGRFRRQLVELAGVREGERVLDVGCGTGSLAIAASRAVGKSGSVIGIDPSPEFIRRAAAKARRARMNATFQAGAAQDLPFEDGSFDVVMCTFVLHQLPPAALHKAAAEMARVVQPGGRVLIVDIGGEQGARQTVHVRAAARHGVHLFDLREATPMLGHIGLTERASGELPFRLSFFERVQYVLAGKG
jgi:ubiquinone/menaquinone biosynthesis C-methylase UbiE